MRANEFAEWAEERRGKLLHELQIEQCQYVIDHATELHGFSAEQEEKYLGQLREQVAELEKTRVPIVTGTFPGTIRPLFAARIARYRSEYGAMAESQLKEKQAQKHKNDETSGDKPE